MTANLLAVLFLDHPALTCGFFLALLLALVARKFRYPGFPFPIAMLIWCGLMLAALVVAIAWSSAFFAHGKGIDRLVLVPVLMGAAPLFIFATIAMFLRPRRRRFGDKYPYKTQ